MRLSWIFTITLVCNSLNMASARFGLGKRKPVLCEHPSAFNAQKELLFSAEKNQVS